MRFLHVSSIEFPALHVLHNTGLCQLRRIQMLLLNKTLKNPKYNNNKNNNKNNQKPTHPQNHQQQTFYYL